MRRAPLTRRIPGRSVLGNLGARVVAVLALAGATVLVARLGGAEDVGILALLRVLPGLFGVLAACGLPGATGYFLAGPDSRAERLWPTIRAVMVLGAAGGTTAWLLLSPVIASLLLPGASPLVLALAGLTVATQLPVAVSKSSLQALDDRSGSNIVTAAEELAFVPAYLLAQLAGLTGGLGLVTSLLAADVAVATWGWIRLRHRAVQLGIVMHGRPDRVLARRIVSFGLRGQVGGIVGLLNLRLDFILLGAMAGPAALGVYAVASKFAELVRLPALAVTWVTYPAVARQGPARAAAEARRQLPVLLAVGVVGAGVIALVVGPLLPLIYGPAFEAAVAPTRIIVCGLVAAPAGGLASGFLLGTRRPGTNSLLLGAGLVVTVTLDALLIPRLGVTGAAVASAAAYLTTDVSLLVVLGRALAGAR
ncbi:oligosaccharide flippase family protein [Humibacillus xanthopallidus]|uniref:oligosaccharide flippase family protein n=1 Tax=Humibacillus xanthopallidus TaxID=412689 RepID=UPI00163A9952|nr:oligosaccharide flippase family protein [Humibacillus xanthopallidus]